MTDLKIANMLADYHKECEAAETLREKADVQLKHARLIQEAFRQPPVIGSCFIVKQINYDKMKTITEAAKECEFHSIGNQSHFTPEQIFRYGVAFAEQWIKVEDELPEQVEQLIGNKIQSENVIVKRRWKDTGEIAIEINYRFRPSERIGFLWNYNYEGSEIIEWRPLSRF